MFLTQLFNTPKSVDSAARLLGLLLVSTFFLSGCGGGGGSSGGPPTARMFVAGDSLFDMGTYGFKFTVQSTTATTKIVIDHVAEGKGIDVPCAAYSNVLALANTDCTGFAVGGATISLTPNTAQNIVKQLVDMKATHGTFNDSDLILVDGGGNDFAALTTAFGTWATAAATYAAAPNAGNLTALQTATSGYATVLAPVTNSAQFAAAPAATVTAIATGILTAADAQTTAIGLGVQYSVKLADMLMAAIDDNLLDAGAKRVLVANPPKISGTPAFAAAAALAPVVNGWIGAYNLQLESLVDARGEVEVYNLYKKFEDLTTPAIGASFGFDDVTQAACSTSLSVNPVLCSDAALDALGIDWGSYFFSDSFHGSPLANRVIANDVLSVLNNKGW
jgi:outer membrane lipase/esterase